jgi:hypothetical protein
MMGFANERGKLKTMGGACARRQSGELARTCVKKTKSLGSRLIFTEMRIIFLFPEPLITDTAQFDPSDPSELMKPKQKY